MISRSSVSPEVRSGGCSGAAVARLASWAQPLLAALPSVSLVSPFLAALVAAAASEATATAQAACWTSPGHLRGWAGVHSC